MDDVELLTTDFLTDSLLPLPEIPDFPDIPESVIIVPAAPLPVTSESLEIPLWHSTTTTVTDTNPQLTYVTQGNVSYRYDPYFGMASDATTTTFNVPTATEAPIEPPPLMLVHSPRQAESGSSSPKKDKTDDSVFLPPLPVTSHARPQTRITRNVLKPNPSLETGENKIIKALLAEECAPYLTRVAAFRQRNFIVRASSQTPGVSASMPVPLGDLPPLTQRPSLRSAFVKTTTAADFIPRSSSVDTVITTHVTTTTAITTPMTSAPQLSYAISPIKVATADSTTVTKAVTTSKGQSIVLISTPSPNTRAAKAMRSKTYTPVQHLYKVKADADAAKKIHNLVRSKALPDSPRATVASPTSITMLGPLSLITTTAGAATSVQPPPSANTRAKTHNYAHYEPSEIKIIELPPRSFPGPRTACVAQRQASAAAAMQQQAMMISQMKAARHAQHHAESQAMTGLELGSTRDVQHAASLYALQEASHARLVAASQEVRLKVQKQTLFQAKVQAALETQKAAATSPAATQAQALPAPMQLPVKAQLQVAALGPTQTVSLAQPHGKFNVKLLTPAQAQFLANAKAQFHVTSKGQILGVPQTQRVVYSQAQGQPLDASQTQNESLVTSQLLTSSRPQNEYFTTSHLQGQPLATCQPLATSKPQATSQAQLLVTSQSQGPILITTQQQAQRLAKSQSQGAILVAPQRQALLVTTQSKAQAQSHATIPTQPNVTLPVQIKSTQANATLIAQLNAPPPKIISRGQQKFPRTHFHATPAQLKNITQAQLNAITQAQIRTSQRRQQTASPTVIQMISPPQQSAGHGQPSPRPRRRLIITTGNTAPPIVTQSTTNETVAASTSLNKQLPITSSASHKIGEVPSSSIQSTNTLTLSAGTTLIMPHYKASVFKNLLSIGRGEPTPLPTPTTTSGEIMVVRRSATYFPARRSFPTTTQSLTATSITTPKTKNKTKPVIHIIRTVPRHMLDSLQPGHARPRPDNSEIPTFFINQNKFKTDEKNEEKGDEKSEEK